MPTHNYTVSSYAKQGLISIFHPTKPLHHYHRRPLIEYNPFSAASLSVHAPLSSYHEGLSHAITTLCRNYDFTDWTPRPAKPDPWGTPLYYNPSDRRYILDTLQDYWADPQSYTPRQLDELQAELSLDIKYAPAVQHDSSYRGYGHLSLSLTDDTRRYLVNLLAFHKIPPCLTRRHTTNLTAQVGWCLEVIGTRHLVPNAVPARSVTTLQQLINEPNPRKARAAKARHATRNKLYGNHQHTSYVQKVWHRLPSSISRFTQADVDYCCLPHVHLEDLAQEAAALNPALSFNPTRPIPTPQPAEPQPTAATIRSIAPRTLVSVPASEHSIYYKYKGRNITEPVLIAYQQHYYEPYRSFPEIHTDLAEWQLPLYVLRNNAIKEHVRRTTQSQRQED